MSIIIQDITKAIIIRVVLAIKTVAGPHTRITAHFFITCLATIHMLIWVLTGSIRSFHHQNATHGIVRVTKIPHRGAPNLLWALMVH
ncbi:hypothetical protein QVD17_12764 [Tagetes erecta]|uniref:Uncharacterized protein n=1 Tax=Tagetes erecta TaxID=13708 RepID=A0AAD8KZU0_TARER|nr:hypothetical protein QVD17_12764 [Tagetes erecta]